MPTTINYSGRLMVLTCWCGMRHAVPEELQLSDLIEAEAATRTVETPLDLRNAVVLARHALATHQEGGE